MKLDQTRQAFIDSWGKLGVEWGINRTMAQIHALLLISPAAMDTDGVIETLRISRGNASMNLRALIDWGLVIKQLKPGVRREFFVAEKDVWRVARCIVIQRKRRELDPMLSLLEQALNVEGANGDDAQELEEFRTVVGEIRELGAQADRLLQRVLRDDQTQFFKPIIKLLAR